MHIELFSLCTLHGANMTFQTICKRHFSAWRMNIQLFITPSMTFQTIRGRDSGLDVQTTRKVT